LPPFAANFIRLAGKPQGYRTNSTKKGKIPRITGLKIFLPEKKNLCYF
jgi:hypothetical protein